MRPLTEGSAIVPSLSPSLRPATPVADCRVIENVPNEIDPVSSGLARRLTELVGPERAARYFPESPLIRRSDARYAVVVNNPFVADMLDRRHGQTLTTAAKELAGDVGVYVEFQVEPSGTTIEQSDSCSDGRRRRTGWDAARDEHQPRAAAGSDGDPPPTPSPAPPRRSGPSLPPHRARWTRTQGADTTALRVRPRYQLDDFIVGPSNALAFESAVALADAGRRPPHAPNSIGAGGEDPPFNLLVLHGECGLGKTHLMNGIATRFAQNNPGARIHCTTAEAFTNEYITAIRTSSIDQFRTRRRKLELLCIDDLHFLSNKSATQTEFLHTFDTLGLRGARIVLVTDEHPSLIQRLSKELSSRMLSGMVVEVGAPDFGTRVRIIERLASRRGLDLAPGVAESIAERATGTVRNLVGAITTLDAVRRMPEMRGLDQRLSLELVEQALGSTNAARPAIKPIRVETITETVAREVGVETTEVLGRGRHKRVVLARALIVHLAKELTTLSYPEIARAMNRPNHSSVITARQRIERQILERKPCDLGPAFEGVGIPELVDRLLRRLLDGAERL